MYRMCVEIKMEGTEYCGYCFGKPITKQKSIEKCLKKILTYVKGQS